MKNKTPHRFTLKYGILVAAVPIFYHTFLVVFDLLETYYGDDPGGSLKVPTQIYLLTILIVVAIYRFKKWNNGYLKMNEALGIGLKIALTATAFMIAYHLLFNAILAPSFHESYYAKYGSEVYKELVDCCDYTKEQFEQHKHQRIAYDRGKGYVGDLFLTMTVGLVISTIFGLILRKKNNSSSQA